MAHLSVSWPDGPLVPEADTATVVTVLNDSSIVESYELSVVGGPAGWSKVEPALLRLMPGQVGRATITFHPMAPSVAAGAHPVGVRAVPHGGLAHAVTVEGEVEVGPCHRISADLRPKTARAHRRGRYRLTVVNRGNVVEHLRAVTDDPDERLDATASPINFDLGPGQSSVVRLRAQPLGHADRGERLVLQVLVRGGHDLEPVEIDGGLVVRPLTPPWVIRVAALAVTLLGALAVWMLVRGDDGVQTTATRVGQRSWTADVTGSGGSGERIETGAASSASVDGVATTAATVPTAAAPSTLVPGITLPGVLGPTLGPVVPTVASQSPSAAPAPAPAPAPVAPVLAPPAPVSITAPLEGQVVRCPGPCTVSAGWSASEADVYEVVLRDAASGAVAWTATPAGPAAEVPIGRSGSFVLSVTPRNGAGDGPTIRVGFAVQLPPVDVPAISSPAQGQEVVCPATCVLTAQWAPVPGASAYRAELLAGGAVVSAADVEAPSAALSPVPGPLVLRVWARNAAGSGPVAEVAFSSRTLVTRVSRSGSELLVDDESWPYSDERRMVSLPNTDTDLVTPGVPVEVLVSQECAGDELVVVLKATATLESIGGAVLVHVTADLYEQTNCSATDHDGSWSGDVRVEPGSSVPLTFTVRNTAEGGDYANVTLSFTSVSY